MFGILFKMKMTVAAGQTSKPKSLAWCPQHESSRLNAALYRTVYRPVPLQEYILCGHDLLNPDGSQAGKHGRGFQYLPGIECFSQRNCTYS